MVMDYLVATKGDPNNAGGGNLIAQNPQTVFVNNIPVIEDPDPAAPDSVCPIPPHCNPATAEGSDTVFVYNNPIHRERDLRICGHSTIVRNQDNVFAGD
jgi:uncharacterized Zn-binding protein involved in type VI secretion